ncbi:hypothetical protein DM02DRAFT_705733 [Periconia macrospinosa]|uniref:Uncharacterized protein n=1 Tax=Periconia macrospinosa TaxID=97972 RepID=A0A2V1E9A6_9PLEO|nr:hypothetical protein DM02DRAFT_705733 [Periconia macrospinosa]
MAVFDRRSMLWFSDSCNPFLDMTVRRKLFVSRTALELDRMEGESEPVLQGLRNISFASKAANTKSAEDRLLNNALRHAVYAYAINWLPLQDIFRQTRGVDHLEAQRMEQDVRAQLWRQARTSVLPALSRPSYRSVVALILVSFTEMPIENEDPGFNHLCCQVQGGYEH